MSLKALARSAAFLLILALAAPCLANENLATLSHSEVFVGDRAVFTYIEENLPLKELFGELEAGAPAVKAFDVPRELIPADTADISIKSARLIPLQGKEDAALCEITFVPWKTGEVAIPQIAFTPDGARRSKTIKVKVASLASRSGATSLMPNRPPVLPPGTLYLLYALVLVAASLCFAAFLAARRLLRLRRGHRRIPIKRIRREFKKLIKDQRLLISDGEPGWYAELACLARLFFYRMTDERKYLAATAQDIAGFLEDAASSSTYEEAAAAKGFITLLFQIEQIRFSGEGSGWDRVNKINYIEAFDEFVGLACAYPSAFFGVAEEEPPPLAKRGAAVFGKKGKSRAVV